MSGELNFLIGFGLKPAVLVLSVLALRLVRRRPAGRGRALLALSLAAFMAGELFCAVDVYVRRRMTLFDEGAHDGLMALAFGLFALGLYVLARETRPCLNAGCGRNRECRLRPEDCPESTAFGPIVGWLLAGAAVAAIIPFLARPGVFRALLPAGVGARSFGAYLYDRTPALSLLQQKALPALAALALLMAAASYAKERRVTGAGARLAALGAGTLAFSFYRLILVHVFHPEAVLTAFVEELLEALFLVLVLAGFGRRGPEKRPA